MVTMVYRRNPRRSSTMAVDSPDGARAASGRQKRRTAKGLPLMRSPRLPHGMTMRMSLDAALVRHTDEVSGQLRHGHKVYARTVAGAAILMGETTMGFDLPFAGMRDLHRLEANGLLRPRSDA